MPEIAILSIGMAMIRANNCKCRRPLFQILKELLQCLIHSYQGGSVGRERVRTLLGAVKPIGLMNGGDVDEQKPRLAPAATTDWIACAT